MAVIINSSQFSMKPTQKHKPLLMLITLAAIIILSSILLNNSPPSTNQTHHPFNSFLKKTCAHTLYSSLCHSTLSSTPNLTSTTTFLHILRFTINRTADHVKLTQIGIRAHFTAQFLNNHEKNALKDCIEMLDQTVYELQQAIDQLNSLSSSSSYPHKRSSYGNIKTLLSAAMTNENTCINGFSDLEGLDPEIPETGHTEHLQNLLTPISHMISNSLALIKHVENTRAVKKSKPVMVIGKKANYVRFVRSRRRRKNMVHNLSAADVIVAFNGSGNYRSISEAIEMAPNMSKTTYMIKIMEGIYEENVLIPREKMNIMLVGDGMNRTVITGSRNFADGFSTFESATLIITRSTPENWSILRKPHEEVYGFGISPLILKAVVGDKFLASDLTIINTSPPEKHQAVALRVTSNAAFYRCEIISHQDTLYAHSLRQFYHDCTIQGTVDFIFGNAAAVFQNCTILVRKPILGQMNMITAQGREDPNQNTGISLQNCTIEAAKEFNPTDRKNITTYLGRPWRNYSRTVVVSSYLGDLINPRGWLEWNEYSSLDTVEYIEYMNSGPGSDTGSRVSWGGYRRNCSEDIVRQFGVGEFLHGPDNWLESTVLPLFGGS
ncbi:hypothetical protein CASFOL_013686 [Castilleja foliolosa]|uniref:Pectinesterase n=1 Tax=Castilleja foliolosa TaxID=1961234 RepID=A0ABD3DMG1_9LAMI